jgi:hypothetical protein
MVLAGLGALIVQLRPDRFSSEKPVRSVERKFTKPT